MKRLKMVLIALTLALGLCSCGKESPFGKTEVVDKKLNTVSYQVPKEWAEETTKDVNLYFPGGLADPNASYFMIASIEDQPLDEYIDGIFENGDPQNFKKEEATIGGNKGYKISFSVSEETGDSSCIMYSVSIGNGVFSVANFRPSDGDDYSDYLDKIVSTISFE